MVQVDSLNLFSPQYWKINSFYRSSAYEVPSALHHCHFDIFLFYCYQKSTDYPFHAIWLAYSIHQSILRRFLSNRTRNVPIERGIAHFQTTDIKEIRTKKISWLYSYILLYPVYHLKTITFAKTSLCQTLRMFDSPLNESDFYPINETMSRYTCQPSCSYKASLSKSTLFVVMSKTDHISLFQGMPTVVAHLWDKT